MFEHPEDLGAVQGEMPGSVWQFDETLELISATQAVSFAIQQCHFGAATPKPTRFATTLQVDDSRCFAKLPSFDKFGNYKGPLPKNCGRVHKKKLIGKTCDAWNTGPSASYPPKLCKFLAGLILTANAAFGGGNKKRPIPWNRGDDRSKKPKINVLTEEVIAAEDERLETEVGSEHCNGGDHVSNGVGTDGVRSHQAVDQRCGDFDIGRCLNAEMPVEVEWDNKRRHFVDGFGLCSPGRWPPRSRGVRRSAEMKRLASDTFKLLREAVADTIPNPRDMAFKLVTGKLRESPFPLERLQKLRQDWALPDPKEALVVDEDQPFLLRGLAQWLRIFEDPDVGWLVDEEDSFSTGVCLGVEKPVPRSPQN